MYLLQGLKTGFECPDDNNGATVGDGRCDIATATAQASVWTTSSALCSSGDSWRSYFQAELDSFSVEKGKSDGFVEKNGCLADSESGGNVLLLLSMMMVVMYSTDLINVSS